jgi:hypothetical protein
MGCPGKGTTAALEARVESATSVNTRVTKGKLRGPHFAGWAKGEENDAELKGQERVAILNRGRCRSARARGEILGGRVESYISPRRPSFTGSRSLLSCW